MKLDHFIAALIVSGLTMIILVFMMVVSTWGKSGGGAINPNAGPYIWTDSERGNVCYIWDSGISCIHAQETEK